MTIWLFLWHPNGGGLAITKTLSKDTWHWGTGTEYRHELGERMKYKYDYQKKKESKRQCKKERKKNLNKTCNRFTKQYSKWKLLMKNNDLFTGCVQVRFVIEIKTKYIKTTNMQMFMHVPHFIQVSNTVYMRVCTHSVVEGDEHSGWVVLVCLSVCCSLGEEGREESVISSNSSWDDWGLLVFFLLNACLKELRNCK